MDDTDAQKISQQVIKAQPLMQTSFESDNW